MFDFAFIQTNFQPFIHTSNHIHTYTHKQRWSHPRRPTASWSGAVRVRGLARAQRDTQLGDAGDRTSNLQLTSQPALPPELLPPRTHNPCSRRSCSTYLSSFSFFSLISSRRRRLWRPASSSSSCSLYTWRRRATACSSRSLTCCRTPSACCSAFCRCRCSSASCLPMAACCALWEGEEEVRVRRRSG